MVGQFRQSVFGRLGGYDDVNDADRLSLDPVMRWIVGGHAVTKQAASSSQMGRFETEVLATEENLAALGDLSGRWIDRVHDRCPPKKIILDMDSSVSPTHGAQEGSTYNVQPGWRTYFRLHLLSSPVPVQPVRRFGTVRPASRQRSQRRWLAQGAGAGSGTLQGKGFASVFRVGAMRLLGRLPGQNKKQREGLSLLVATMLDVRSANLMDLAASLPRAAERLDMRYQWISRLLGNDLIEVDAVIRLTGHL